MWRLLVVLAGCSFGAGPVIGYGQRGFVLGGEAGGGILGLEATGGYEHGLAYGRVDLNAYGGDTSFDGTVRTLARVGLGGGFTTSQHPDGEHQQWHLMAIAGAGPFRSTTDAHARCSYGSQDATIFSATLELRYAGQFEIVVHPRYELMMDICPIQ